MKLKFTQILKLIKSSNCENLKYYLDVYKDEFKQFLLNNDKYARTICYCLLYSNCHIIQTIYDNFDITSFYDCFANEDYALIRDFIEYQIIAFDMDHNWKKEIETKFLMKIISPSVYLDIVHNYYPTSNTLDILVMPEVVFNHIVSILKNEK